MSSEVWFTIIIHHLVKVKVGVLRLFIYLFRVLRCFQHCTGHITAGSWKGRGNQYIQFVRVLYCKLTTNGKQLPAFPLEAVPGIEPWPQRWEARVLPLCHHGPVFYISSTAKVILGQVLSIATCRGRTYTEVTAWD